MYSIKTFAATVGAVAAYSAAYSAAAAWHTRRFDRRNCEYFEALDRDSRPSRAVLDAIDQLHDLNQELWETEQPADPDQCISSSAWDRYQELSDETWRAFERLDEYYASRRPALVSV